MVEGERTARQQLQTVGSPAAGDERELLAPSRGQEHVNGPRRLSYRQEGLGESHGCPGRNEPLVNIFAEVDALLGRGRGQVHVTGGKRDGGAVEEVPNQCLRVAQVTGGL